jgi:hypothetical protein
MKESVIKYSPWGAVQKQKVLAPGIVQVFTAGHGGIWLSPERQAQLPEWAKQIASSYAPKPQWWEEDCEMAIPLLVFYSEVHQHFSCSREALEREIKMFKYLNFPAKTA